MDPGWRGASRYAWWGFVPGLGARRIKNRAASGDFDALSALRGLFLSFTLALLGFGVLLTLLDSGNGLSDKRTTSPTIWAGVVVASAIYGFVGAPRIERPLSCQSDQALAGSYRTRFFLRVAFSEVVALIAFVGVFTTGKLWVYALGLVLAAPGFLRLAPTAANLAKDQQDLHAAGCGRSLVGALRGGPKP
jgi:hypothetical protein